MADEGMSFENPRRRPDLERLHVLPARMLSQCSIFRSTATVGHCDSERTGTQCSVTSNKYLIVFFGDCINIKLGNGDAIAIVRDCG